MKIPKQTILYIAWSIALVAMLGSLFFSNVLGFAPCILCWYQRILMYPLVAILAVGILKKDTAVWVYVLPLSVIGALVALYHFLLNINVIPEKLAPCTFGVSCTAKYFNFFGFINIPFLSLLAFISITILMLWYKNTAREGNNL